MTGSTSQLVRVVGEPPWIPVPTLMRLYALIELPWHFVPSSVCGHMIVILVFREAAYQLLPANNLSKWPDPGQPKFLRWVGSLIHTGNSCRYLTLPLNVACILVIKFLLVRWPPDASGTNSSKYCALTPLTMQLIHLEELSRRVRNCHLKCLFFRMP